MKKSLLFIPDISGFTKFVQSTEKEHSLHVISELFDVLIDANTEKLELAEVEGDALFFYKNEDVPPLEKLLSQIESMFTAFHSHLKLLEKNRICPCNACATAPNLELKIIAHCGELQFITVQDYKKPFGIQVIEAHRLLKNSVNGNNYALISKELAQQIKLPENYSNDLYHFNQNHDDYDGNKIDYTFSIINQNDLQLKPFSKSNKVHFNEPPRLLIEKEFPVSAATLMEYITNYTFRQYWVEGVDSFKFNENEVTRLGTEHVCVIDGKHFNFDTVSKDVKPDQLVYGEMTTSPPPVDELYQFFIISPINDHSCTLEIELYWKAKSPIKKLLIFLFVKKLFFKNAQLAIDNLYKYIAEKNRE